MNDALRHPVADEDVRQRVIHTLDRPLVVEAGAGTGKTTLLVSRLLYALENSVVRMREIVAISFTEKAAAELRWRLRQALESRCASLDAAAPGSEALGRALHELHEAHISTIHAFAASILRERPVEAQLDPQFRTLDELESLQLQRAFWKRWVDEELEGDEAARLLLPALQVGVRVSPDLEVLARSLYDNRDLQHLLSPPQVSPDLEDDMRRFRDDLLRCVRHGEENCTDEADKGLLHLRQLRGRVEVLEELQMSSWPAVFLGELKIGVTRGRQAAWRGSSAAENKAQRRALQEDLQRIQQRISHRILRGSLQWLARWLAAYEAEKRRQGVLDFQDLLLQAQQLVRNDLAVRLELGKRIGMLCIDEFQDTDPLQAQLALFLAETGRPAPEWHDVTVGDKLFVVGDPKQSIYRFRRADLDVYQRCCDIVRRSGGEVLDIVQNFRSRPAILQWTNAVFESLFASAQSDPSAPDTGTSNEPRHVPLVPLPESDTTRPAVWVLRADPQDTSTSEPGGARSREAHGIVGMIERALREQWPVRQDGASRALAPRHIALLFGRTSGIELYEDALRQAGIPFRQEGGKLFFQRQEVRDILHALAACDDPQDEWSIVAALRSPLFGASDEDLWRHRQRFGAFRTNEPCDGSPLQEAFDVLHDLHRRHHGLGIAGCVETLLSRTAARAVYAVQPQGARALTNFEMLTRQARLFEATGNQGLREFVRSLRELEDETPRLAEWAPEEEAGDHVRLLTVHMAKGLEFPFVVLANLNTQGNPSTDPLLFDRLQKRAEARLGVSDLMGTTLKTEGFAEVAERERRKQEAEDHRLLYVAATRARDYLVIGDVAGDRVAGYLKTLRSVPGALGDGRFGELGIAVEATAEPIADATWCVVDSASLPRRRRRAAANGSTGSRPLSEWLQQRDVWSSEHAHRLQRGARPGGRVSPVSILTKSSQGAALDAARRDASRLGRVTHAVLGEWEPDLPRGVVGGLIREVCEREGADDLFDDIAVFVERARSDATLGVWWNLGRVVGRAVPMQVRVADRFLEARQDVLIETAQGVACIDYTLRAHADTDVRTEEHVQSLHGAVLLRSGRKLARVGTLYLADGVWRELENAEEKSRSFLDRLSGKRSAG